MTKAIIGRTEPVHARTGLTLTGFRAAEARAHARRERRRNRRQDREQQIRFDEQKAATNAAIAAAPEQIDLDELLKKYPKPRSHRPRLVAGGRFVLVRATTKSWALLAGNGQRVVGGDEFSTPQWSAAAPKPPGIGALTDLAEHLVKIRDAEDRPAPWASPEPQWHLGWRGPDGLTIPGAVTERLVDWATARGLQYARAWRAGEKQPRPVIGGTPDQDGFYRRDAGEAGPGDRVRCADGVVRTVVSNTVAKRYERGNARYVLVLTFADGTKLADGPQRRTDILFEGDPDAPESVHNPGMGSIIGGSPGIPADQQTGRHIALRPEDLIPVGTRVALFNSEDQADWYDLRPTTGVATDHVFTSHGEVFQAFHYDDDTYDGVKPSAFRSSHKDKRQYLINPTTEQVNQARAAWGLPPLEDA